MNKFKKKEHETINNTINYSSIRRDYTRLYFVAVCQKETVHRLIKLYGTSLTSLRDNTSLVAIVRLMV